jgi:hypothetical protein
MGTAPLLARFKVELYLHPEKQRTVMILECKFCESVMAVPAEGLYSKDVLSIITIAHTTRCPPASL